MSDQISFNRFSLLAALVAYTYQVKKPSLNIRSDDLAALPATIFKFSYVELTLH
jgi:hypothetical protein